MACGIWVPRPGIEPGPRQWKHWLLTTGLQGNLSFFLSSYWKDISSHPSNKYLFIRWPSVDLMPWIFPGANQQLSLSWRCSRAYRNEEGDRTVQIYIDRLLCTRHHFGSLHVSVDKSPHPWWADILASVTEMRTETILSVRNVVYGEIKEGGDRSRVLGDFPGSPVVKTLRFHCRGHGFDPWPGN